MDRNEFVSTLRAVLSGEVPAAVVEDNVRYYDSYISQEIADGKSEREVLESLGDPRLIAKTIIDTNKQQGSRETYESAYTREEPEKGFHAEFNDNGGVDLKYRQLNLNTWYGRLLIFIIVILVLTVIFTIVGGILSWLLPILLPVLLIVWILRFFFGNR
ncbi:MAG: DUF1700 domain-containing protein [Lachnospiraceae bacterium]|jgi:predicted lactoylglutathione lyase|nr:DUF1700 domain-containing protein [Lachnospiraceae bacterium]